MAITTRSSTSVKPFDFWFDGGCARGVRANSPQFMKPTEICWSNELALRPGMDIRKETQFLRCDS